jgi:hypothetical protein
MKPDYFIYKGKIGIYVVTDKALLAYHGSTWSTFRDPTQAEWVMIDLVKAQRICELELLVLTGISTEELQEKIAGVQDGD